MITLNRLEDGTALSIVPAAIDAVGDRAFVEGEGQHDYTGPSAVIFLRSGKSIAVRTSYVDAIKKLRDAGVK